MAKKLEKKKLGINKDILTDFNEFVEYYFPQKNDNGETTHLTDFHLKFASQIINNKFDNLVLFEAFRGSAKSTVLKYVLIYLLIKKELDCVLYVSKTENF